MAEKNTNIHPEFKNGYTLDDKTEKSDQAAFDTWLKKATGKKKPENK